MEKITENDWTKIFSVIKSEDSNTRREYVTRWLFYQAGFHNCYALKNKNGEIASILWIVYPSENEKLMKHYKSELYRLKDNEVLLENVFTLPKFRGFGFSPTITTELMKLAKTEGYKSVVAIIYSMKSRIASMNDMISIGFRINKLVKEYRFLGFLWRVD